MRSGTVFVDLILQLVLSDPGHSRPAVQGRNSLPKDIFCLEKLINVDTLLLELDIFRIFAMLWTKKIIFVLLTPKSEAKPCRAW